MGEKYSPEKLEAMRSVAHNKSGRIRHNPAGLPIKDSTEMNHQRVTVDEGGNVYRDNADGTQDLTLNPQPIRAGAESASIG